MLCSSSWSGVDSNRAAVPFMADLVEPLPGPQSQPWWEADAPPARVAKSLQGDVTADVCVVGGGFAGLWSAIRIRQALGDARVVLLERDYCGSGASGRNGGWATTWYLRIDKLVERFGDELAVKMADASSSAIGDIARLAEEFEFECEFRKAGSIWCATAPAHVGKWNPAIRECERLGRPRKLVPVDAETLRSEVGSPMVLGGVREADSAAVHPGLLVLGLRKVAEAVGVEIYERTPASVGARGGRPHVKAPSGSVSADRVVVTTGAWTAREPRFRRMTLPVASSVLVTEPVPERLRGQAWTNGTLVKDSRLSLHYIQVTPEGRIVFGRGGGALASAGRIGPRHMYDGSALREAAADFARWFPHLKDVRFTHAWSGPVDFAPGALPLVGNPDGDDDVIYAVGFSGNGVAPSALLGQVVADTIAGTVDAALSSALSPPLPGYFFPEPLRGVGGALVRGAIVKYERGEERGKSLPGGALLKRLPDMTVPALLERRPLRSPPAD